LLGVVLLLGFYLTPVFYDLGAAPANLQLVFQLNPMVHVLGAYRAALLGSAAVPWLALAVISLAATVLILAGYRVFMRASYHFAEEL
jgi:lipopolysaccharide transport system permease protein